MAVTPEQANGAGDVITSEYLRGILKGIDPWTFDPTALDVPDGTTTVYHGTANPELITPGSISGGPIGDTPSKYTFVSPRAATAAYFGDVILEGKVDTPSFQRGFYSNYYGEPQAVLSAGDAYKVLKGGEVGQVLPQYRIGPFNLLSPDELAFNQGMPPAEPTRFIRDEFGNYVGEEDIPFYKTRAAIKGQAEVPIKKALGTAARLAGPLNLVGAGLAANKYWNEGRPLTSGFATLSALPGPAGWGGLALEGLSNVGAGVREGAEQLGEYLTSPDQELRTLDLPLVDQMGEYIANRDNNMAVTPTQQALIDAEALFASGNFDMGSDAALKALPMNRSRPDLWQNEVILNQPDPEDSYTGVSYFDTYEGIRDPSIPSIDPPPSWTYLGRGLDRSVMSAEPIESTAILEALAAREFFDSPLGEERGHVRTGPMLGSLVNQGKVDLATAEEFANLYGNLRPSGYNVTYGREGTPSRVDISESAAEVPWLNYPLGRIRGTVQAPTQEEFEGWQPPVYPIGNRGWRPDLRGHTLIPPGTQVPTESAQRGTWRDIIKRVLSPISTAQAGSGFVPGKSVTVEVEQTPEEDFAITEALMQLDEPRIPFSLPPEARGVFTEEVQAPFILDQQVDPYTSITTLPIGEEGWNPTLLSDTLGGTVTDQPRTNLDGTITYLTNAQAMASDVQRALDRAGRIGPAPPVTSVESQLQALTELAQTDPTIAARYTTPGSQDLIDITSQVESFANIPEALPEPEPVSSDSREEQRKEAAKQKRRDKKAAAKQEAADKRAADRAAAKSARMSAAQKRNIARVAKASRKAEAAREAATKKAAEDQRRKDAEAQKIWEQHKKWAAENAKKLREREANRLKQMGYKKPVTGSQFIYT